MNEATTETSRRSGPTLSCRSIVVVVLLGVASLILNWTLTDFVVKENDLTVTINDAPIYSGRDKRRHAQRMANQVQSPTVTRSRSSYNMQNSSTSLLSKSNNNCTEQQTGKTSETTKRDEIKPIKVFILMGQSNMYGQGMVHSGNEFDAEHTLDYAVFRKKRFQHLIHQQASHTIDNNSNINWKQQQSRWKRCPNVRYVHLEWVDLQTKLIYDDWLTVEGRDKIGPEIEIGWALRRLYGDDNDDENDNQQQSKQQIMLLKACTGNRDLGWALLPPGSKRYFDRASGFVYAGYKDSPEKWQIGTTPKPGHWYGGIQYDHDTEMAKEVLAKLDVPYEIAGFFWWQGAKDQYTNIYSRLYERNLVQLIKALRKDFKAADDTPFVLATVGFDGHKMTGSTLQIWKAQMAVNNHQKYPEFKGNVEGVDIRDSWRRPSVLANFLHYGFHAETYMEVGQAMGKAMVNLISRQACGANDVGSE